VTARNPLPLWRQVMAKWSDDQLEEWNERVALVLDGCRSEGMTVEQAERAAFDVVSRWAIGGHTP